MPVNNGEMHKECRALLKDLDTNRQAEISAQLFLEYCVYQDQCENTKRLAPLINTVAEALVKKVDNDESLQFGIRAVQMYLRTPPVEYFGEALSRLGYLDRESIEEMVQIQPEGKIFGTFLMEQGLITQEQRDLTVMAQKRLFTIHEVHTRLLKKDAGGAETDLAESLQGVFQHFLRSTSEIENDLKQSKAENIHYTLQRLEDIITETEKQSHCVLGIAERVFALVEEMTALSESIREHVDPANSAAIEQLESLSEKLGEIYAANMDLNSSQQIQDRIGQQMLKIIPSVKMFHDQLLKIAEKLNLNWDRIASESPEATEVGYGGMEEKERVEQTDVDDLLSSLGL
jgi:chemotaxis regulatin CheY-phosphate phosphatase CheZ